MCHYHFLDGSQCELDDAGKGLCFWHDPTISKAGKNLVSELEAIAKAGHKMEGFSLTRANLEGINLVRHGNPDGYCFASADFYRANLKNAHLFQIDLKDASLMKADCREANLHFANLENTNLLGARFDGAKIENIHWGRRLFHKQKALEAEKSGRHEGALDFLEQAEEICRHLRKVSEAQGLFELAGHFFHEEMKMRRFQMPPLSIERIGSWLVDIFCGYGEKPMRVIAFSLCIIFMCSFAFFLLGIGDSGQRVAVNLATSWQDNFMMWGKTLYFSVVTFTTLGYGDLVPIGFSRVVAAIEAFTGSFTLALFVVVFVKKMTR